MTKPKQPRPPKFSHQWIDARNLAQSRLIAEKIRREPKLFNQAVKTLRHWKRITRPFPHCLKEWEKIISRHTPDGVLKILTQENEEGNRLRQSDPFCGILTEQERLKLLDEYEAQSV